MENYPGVDLRCYAKEGHLEYDLVLSRGATLAPVEVTVEGAQSLRLGEDGTLALETAVCAIRQAAPKTFELDGTGRRRELLARYELRGPDRFGFVVPEWGGEKDLVLDPGVVWSTYIGGSADEHAYALSVDSTGVVTIAGGTNSASYPATPGAWDTTCNSAPFDRDAFVTRLDPSQVSSQQLLYSTFVGGAFFDEADALSVDPSGVVTIAGRTSSSYFPTTPGAWDTTFNSSSLTPDAFVARLGPSQPSSQQLLYSTFVGGFIDDSAFALSSDASGVVSIAGSTGSADYPTTPGAGDTTLTGAFFPLDAFVARLDPSLPSSQ
jgi:hypothetical protein